MTKLSPQSTMRLMSERMHPSGKFVVEEGLSVVLEGPFASGKTSNIIMLDQRGHLDDTWVYTREPGGTPLGEYIRPLVQGELSEQFKPDSLTSLFLYLADRRHHVKTKVLPFLKQGKNVIWDRHGYSSIAYQGVGGVYRSAIYVLNLAATGGFKPTGLLHFDVPVEVSRERMFSKSDLDRFDKMGPEFHQKVRNSYLSMAKIAPLMARLPKSGFPHRWVKIDGVGTRDEVFERTVRGFNGIVGRDNAELSVFD